MFSLLWPSASLTPLNRHSCTWCSLPTYRRQCAASHHQTEQLSATHWGDSHQKGKKHGCSPYWPHWAGSPHHMLPTKYHSFIPVQQGWVETEARKIPAQVQGDRENCLFKCSPYRNHYGYHHFKGMFQRSTCHLLAACLTAVMYNLSVLFLAFKILPWRLISCLLWHYTFHFKMCYRFHSITVIFSLHMTKPT